MKNCWPRGTCKFCLARPAQLPAKGYCVACEAARVPGNASHLPECSQCGHRHVSRSGFQVELPVVQKHSREEAEDDE